MPTVAPSNRPSVVANPAAPPKSPARVETVAPMGTMPPFGGGATTAPFAGAPTEVQFDFNPEPPPKVRWFSLSTVLLLVGGMAGYYQYQRMKAAPPEPVVAAVLASGESAPASTGVVTPFTALKQAKATIKDAGEKHKAAYDLVEKMLDDPNASLPVAVTPKLTTASGPESKPTVDATGKTRGDYVTATLGRDGEFVVPAGSPRPSLAFVRWIKAVKIGGARITDRPRVLVGAGAYTFGDVVEVNLGIVLDGYNAVTRSLRFTEPSGAVIERRL